jgi:hypothetical protein
MIRGNGLNGFDFLEFGLLTIEYYYSTKRDGGTNSAIHASSANIEGSLKFLKRQCPHRPLCRRFDGTPSGYCSRLRVSRCRDVAGTSTGRQHPASVAKDTGVAENTWVAKKAWVVKPEDGRACWCVKRMDSS